MARARGGAERLRQDAALRLTASLAFGAMRFASIAPYGTVPIAPRAVINVAELALRPTASAPVVQRRLTSRVLS